MPSTSKSKRKLTQAQEAVVALRQALSFTQEDLARYMRRDRSTIGRWESIRPPRGHSLVELAKVAHDFGRLDLRDLFSDALNQEFEITQGGGTPPYPSLPLELAITQLYNLAHPQKKTGRNSRVSRAFGKALRLLVDAHRTLVEEIEKGRFPTAYAEDYKSVQIEIETMEEAEEKQNAGK